MSAKTEDIHDNRSVGGIGKKCVRYAHDPIQHWLPELKDTIYIFYEIAIHIRLQYKNLQFFCHQRFYLSI